jgi:hypothetical protein
MKPGWPRKVSTGAVFYHSEFEEGVVVGSVILREDLVSLCGCRMRRIEAPARQSL